MLKSDFRNAFAQWRRAPLVTAVAVLSLAFGVGLNGAFFTVWNALVLKPLPGRHTAEVVTLRDERRRTPAARVSSNTWAAIRDGDWGFTGTAAYSVIPIELADRGKPSATGSALFVSGSYFAVLGIDAHRGRLLQPSDDVASAPLIAVISSAFWESAFGSDPTVIGRSMSIERQPVEIVGISERSFFGLEVGRTFDVAMTLAAHNRLFPSNDLLAVGNAPWLSVIGRVGPGHSVPEAEARLRTVQPRIARAASAPWLLESVSSFDGGLRKTYASGLLLLLAISGGVLLVSCANIANLLLARSAARANEFALRAAVGAERRHLLRQVLAESLAIATVGTTAGAWIGDAGSRLLVSLFSTFSSQVHLEVTPDSRVIAFFVLTTCVVTACCAAIPAWNATQANPIGLLSAKGVCASHRHRMLYVLCALQMTTVFVLTLLGAAFLKSLIDLTTPNLGFERNRVLLASVNFVQLDTPRDQRAALASAVHHELNQVVGVEVAAISQSLPFGSTNYVTKVPGSEEQILFSYVTPQYFRTLGLGFVAGNAFDAEEPRAAVVTETFAREHLGGPGAVGQTFHLQGLGADPFRVTGVVADIRHTNLRDAPPAFVYLPWGRTTRPPGTLFHVLLRISSENSVAGHLVAAAVERAAPGAAATVRSLDAEATATVNRERAIAIIAGTFGSVALLLAAVGLYGVTAYTANRRRPEIALRLALGAGARDIRWLLLRDLLIVCGSGALLGLILATMLAKPLEQLLYRNSTIDVGVIAPTLVLVIFVAGAATYVPYRRALAADPAATLKAL